MGQPTSIPWDDHPNGHPNGPPPWDDCILPLGWSSQSSQLHNMPEDNVQDWTRKPPILWTRTSISLRFLSKYYRKFFITLLIRRAINAVTNPVVFLKHFFRFLAAARSAPPKIGKNATVSFDRCAHWAHRSNGSTTCGWPKKRIAEGEKTYRLQ